MHKQNNYIVYYILTFFAFFILLLKIIDFEKLSVPFAMQFGIGNWERTSDSLNEGLPIKLSEKSFKENDSFF